MSKQEPIYGIDVHPGYQRNLNFERARAEDYEFCVIKASEGPYRDGDTYVPGGFKEYFRRAEAEGFVMGAYHFLVSTPAKAQAEHFLRTIDSVGGPEDKILMVDFEDYPKIPALSPGNEQLEGFISEVKRRIGDHPIVLYAAKGFWIGGDSSGDFDQYGADMAWDAYYLHMDRVFPKRFYEDSENLFHRADLPWGWGRRWGNVEPWFWQFTPAGTVAGMNIDVNAYRGTREQLLALTGEKQRGGAEDEQPEHEGAGHGTNGGGGRKKILAHGVVDGTNFARGFKYVMQLNNHMKYWVWTGGNVPEGEGAYAANKPLPPVYQLKGKRIFCAGVPNLFRRAVGKSIPTRGNPNFDGGIAAYFYTSAFGGLGPGFFSDVNVKFDLAKAKKWARETRSGVLVGRCYRGDTLAGQGHVAILLPDGKVLQSFQMGLNGEPGLNTDYTIEDSHDGTYYQVMVHPEAWINHDKGQVRDIKPDRTESADDDVERDVEHRKPSSMRHTNGRDDRPDGRESMEGRETSDDLDDRDLELEIGKEVLKLIRRYAAENKAPRKRSSARSEKGED
jgi:GH25 family lysozyme M1 (1,4-beta-N-acetylmuramidase)